jgi:hypothetical protein
MQPRQPFGEWLRDASTYGMPRALAVVLIAVLSILGSWACALVHLYVLHVALPPTDLGARQSFEETLRDPFVWSVLSVMAAIHAVLVFPVGLWLLRGLRVLPTFTLVLVLTIVGNSAVMVLAKIIGWPRVSLVSGYVIAIAALVACRQLPALRLPGRHAHA